VQNERFIWLVHLLRSVLQNKFGLKQFTVPHVQAFEFAVDPSVIVHGDKFWVEVQLYFKILQN